MPNSWFRFQQFLIEYGDCGMKVGTDGVLLGAWAGKDSLPKRILDIGTGTGLIALMLRQRFQVRVDALEIEPSCHEQCQKNFESSPWPQDLHAIKGDFNSWHSSVLFDLIVSNPPYFKQAAPAPDARRHLARHQDAGLSVPVLIEKSAKLLQTNGRLALILPIDQANEARTWAINAGLFEVRNCHIRGHTEKPWKRILLEWSNLPAETTSETLTLETSRGHRSAAYQALTADFYLKTPLS
jgi:tRNA1Val (adenine37-N6)-methyltransferase